jgi:hypothetical protein
MNLPASDRQGNDPKMDFGLPRKQRCGYAVH